MGLNVAQLASYERNGMVFPIDIMSTAERKLG